MTSDESLVAELKALIERAKGRQFRDALTAAIPHAYKAGGGITDREVERLQWQPPVQGNGRKRANPANTIWVPDHQGLHLVVSQKNGKTWKVRSRRGGKDVIKVLGTWPAMSAAAAITAWTAFKQTGTTPPRPQRQVSRPIQGLKLSELITKYVNNYCFGIDANGAPFQRNSVAKQNENTLLRFQEAFIEKHGDLPAADITAEMVRPVVLSFETKRSIPSRDGTTTKTVGGKAAYNLMRTNLSNMQKVGMGGSAKLKMPTPWLPASVESWTKSLPKNTTGRGRPLNEHELKSFLGNVDALPVDPVIIDVYKFMLLAGCRISEALSITEDDLHLDAKIPYVTIRPGKVEFTYDLPLSTQAARLLHNQHTNHFRHYVFPNLKTGTHYTSKALQDQLVKRRKFLGQDPAMTSHWLRHTFGTLAAELGYGIEDRDAAMGHTPSGSSDSVYTKTASRKRSVAKMVQDIADHLEGLGLQSTDL